jgi:hypothetical protein
MAVFALLSAGGSPGVTTTALALTLGWPSQVILAECDPSGGDVLAGLLGGHLPASAGLLPLALEAGAGAEVPADTLWRQLVELDEEQNRLLLAGISDPRQSAALQSSLPWIADALKAMAADVIVDCGRLDAVAAVRPVLSAASLAVLVLRPTLRQMSRAQPRVEMLTNLVGRDRVMLLLVGDGSASGREVAKTLGVPVAGQLPDDGRTAAVLSDGWGSRSRLETRPLLRAATAAGRALRDAASAAGPLPGYPEETIFTPSSASQPSLDRYGPGQPGLDQRGSGRADLDSYSPGQPGLEEYASGQPGPDRYGPGQSGLLPYGSDQGGLDPYRPGPEGLDLYSPGLPDPDPFSSGQAGLDRHSLGQPDPDPYSSGQAGLDRQSPGQPDPEPYRSGQAAFDPSSPAPPSFDEYLRDRYGTAWPALGQAGLGQPEPGQLEPGPAEPGQPELGWSSLRRPGGIEPGGFPFGSAQNGSSPNGTNQNGSSPNGSAQNGRHP